LAEVTATFGGLTFSNAATGGGFTLATLDGWYSGAPVRSEVENRPNADGGFGVTRVYKGARVVTQTGLILAESVADPLWSAFSALQANGAPSDYTVTDPAGTLSLIGATLAAPPEITTAVDGLAQYMLQIVGRDPVKYGPEVEYSTGLASGGGGLEYELGEPAGTLYYGALGNLGRVSVVNEGTADTWPIFEVTGELTDGFYIQCLGDGSILRYDRVVPAGTTVTINSRTGSVLIDGVSDASTYLTRDQFFSIPASGACDIQFNAISTSSGSPTMTVTARSGWW
jgi:hypothetical protein